MAHRIGTTCRHALVFPGRGDEPWTEDDYRNWRRRSFAEATKAAGTDSSRPYDPPSLVLVASTGGGRNPLEVAAQMGHLPIMTLQKCGHVIEELRGERPQSAEKLITAARKRCAPNVPRSRRRKKPVGGDLALAKEAL